MACPACRSNPAHPYVCMACKVRTDFTFLNSWGKIKRRVLVTHEVEMSVSIKWVGTRPHPLVCLGGCYGAVGAGQLRQTLGPQSPTHLPPGPLWEKFAGPWCRGANGGDTGSLDKVQIPALPVHGHRERTSGASFSSPVEWGSQLKPLL